MKKLYIINVVLLWFLYVATCYAQKIEIYQVESSDHIINVFVKAIELNELLKNDIFSKTQASLDLERSKVEKYYEKIVLPSIDKCLEKLSVENDNKLAVSFFNLTLSYSNSADEKLPETLFLFFFRNFKLFSNTLSSFDEKQKKQLLEMLNVGWEIHKFSESFSKKQLSNIQNKLDKLHQISY